MPMNQPIFTSVWPGQVHFGFGAIGLLAEELKAMQARHVFIIADPGVIAAGCHGRQGYCRMISKEFIIASR